MMIDAEATPLTPRILHESYVQQVVAELANRGVQVTNLDIRAEQVRQAVMNVAEIDPLGAMTESAEWIRLIWDERYGWFYQVRYPDDPSARSAIYFGVSAVPPPPDVANWMFIGLVHPDVVVSREEGAFQTPDMDVLLAAYRVSPQ
jgi:hypothetical protein